MSMEALINHEERGKRGRYIPEDSWIRTLLRPCLGEFFGTMFFVFAGTMSTNNGSPLLNVAISHALVLAVLVAAAAKVSGGHFNPAVTVAVFLAGEMSILKVFTYIIVQLIGAMTGAGLTRLILPYHIYVDALGGGNNIGTGITAGEAFVCEVFLTAILVLVILTTAVDPETQTAWAPLAIGFTVGGNILAGGAISGAGMNPARSFGPAIVASSIDKVSSVLWSYHYLFWIGPLVGALVSSVLYRLVFASPEKNLVFK